MRAYLDLLKNVLKNGEAREDRTGVGTLGLFGSQTRYDLTEGFPLVTTKQIHWKSVVHELLWFLKGSTNTAYLKEHGVSIWDEWADEDGELGRIYGAQWRSWRSPSGESVDQIANVIKSLRENPMSRRHLVVAWNPGELDAMALPPCHVLFQFYVSNSGGLSCQMYQRSADLFLGVPFNIASYALLTHLIAQLCKLKAETFIHTIGDLHLYKNHLKQAELQVSRTPEAPPQLWLNPNISNLEDLHFEDIKLVNYKPHPSIKAPIAV